MPSAFGCLAAQDGIDNRIQRDARSDDAIAASMLFDVSITHIDFRLMQAVHSRCYSQAGQWCKGLLRPRKLNKAESVIVEAIVRQDRVTNGGTDVAANLGPRTAAQDPIFLLAAT